MEEAKAAAYYEELASKGEGAARFKQGLGFSSSETGSKFPKKDSCVSSTSSFYSSFVKASSPTRAAKYDKEAQLGSIQNKLRRKNNYDDSRKGKLSRVPRDSELRDSSRRSRSKSRERRHRDRVSRNSSKSRSTSISPSKERMSMKLDHERGRTRLPKQFDLGRSDKDRSKGKQRNSGTDYSTLIAGYDNMTPAKRVQARMKLQLQETAGKDKARGTGSGWERFDFNKDAPLDDEEIEAAEDDSAVVKHIGQSFRFSSLEAKREEKIKAAHDEAIFGAPSALNPLMSPVIVEDNGKNEAEAVKPSLLSEKVLRQQGSWRDRARRM